MEQQRRTPPPEARAPRAEAPNSLQATPLAGGVRPHSHHAETKQRPTGVASRFNGRETGRIANNAAIRRSIHVRRNIQTRNNDVQPARRGAPDSAPLSPGKRKRPTADPLGLPSLMSPGTTNVPQQQRRSPPKGKGATRISPNDDTSAESSDSGFRNVQKTALKCVDHASRRQSAAKAALTATAQISSSLKDLVGDSNRAVSIARQSRIEAENAAVRAEGAAKKVQEASDLASQDRQRASLELDEANAQAEEAWELLRQVKGSRKGQKKKDDQMDARLRRTPETKRVPPARIGTVVEVREGSHCAAMSSVADNPLSPRRKAGVSLPHTGSKKQKSERTAARPVHSESRPQVPQTTIPLQFSGDASSTQASLVDPIRRFKGHTSPVTQIAAVDKNRFISSSWDTTIRMWNANTGECIRTFRGHMDWVHAVTVLDRQHFISASDDRTIKMWNVDKEECVRTFKGHTSFVKALAPMDGDRFLSGSRDRTIKLFSTTSEECLQTFQGHKDVISAIVPLDAQHFASGALDNSIKYWDVSSTSCVRTLTGHTGAIKTLASVSDIQIISGSDDRTIRLWDVSTGYCFREFGSKTALVFSVTYICEGFFLACGGNHIKLYHIPSGTCVKSYETPRISLAVVRLDDERFVTGSDQMIHLWRF